MASGDFNHDGTTDLLWEDGSGHTALWLMDPGTGNVALGVASDPVGGAHVVTTGDFNRDGVTDVLWADAAGNTIDWQYSHLTAHDFLI